MPKPFEKIEPKKLRRCLFCGGEFQATRFIFICTPCKQNSKKPTVPGTKL